MESLRSPEKVISCYKSTLHELPLKFINDRNAHPEPPDGARFLGPGGRSDGQSGAPHEATRARELQMAAELEMLFDPAMGAALRNDLRNRFGDISSDSSAATAPMPVCSDASDHGSAGSDATAPSMPELVFDPDEDAAAQMPARIWQPTLVNAWEEAASDNTPTASSRTLSSASSLSYITNSSEDSDGKTAEAAETSYTPVLN